ncbi:uncharacterized protein LOC110639344 isoform X2 [Hevea brasiliensis]|uniref:uncharacterized protein LOC110639344 isoform X2 n=1 Tax=Hevea brasiliensis TaxID=3981 RepID=UPI0025E6239D|nr:uncharacterized protein LOC110639344 isoform X2 [Hevea brasiliensis]
MVLGVNAKNRKGASVQVDYLIHIQEIKPWPPSQSLRSLRSVLIQWENGNRNSGSTDTVVPSLGSIVGEGKIEFNESFRLPVTLIREISGKGKDADSFQKNCLEFNLCEPRRDKIQLLATAVIDLADYGVVKEIISVNAPMSSNRSFRNTSQPVLYVKIQPIDKGHSSSSSKDSPLKGVSHDKDGGKSVSALMNGEYTEEDEMASFTDDDVSSHSSLTNGVLHPQNEENGTDRSTERKGGVNREPAAASKVGIEKHSASQENLKENSSCSSSIDFELQYGTERSTERKVGINREHAVASKLGIEKHIASQKNLKESSSCSSSVDLSSDFGSPVNVHASVVNSPNSSFMLTPKNEVSQSVYSSSSAFNYESKEEEPNINMSNNRRYDFVQEVDEKVPNSSIKIEGDTHQMRAGKNTLERTVATDDIYNSSMEDMNSQDLEDKGHFSEDEPIDTFSQDGTRNEGALGIDTLSSSGSIERKGNILKIDRLKHVKSVRSSSDSSRSNRLVSRNQHSEVREIAALGDLQNTAGSFKVHERKNAKVYPQDTRTIILNGKIQQMEHKIKMLEGELREAAGIEAALYSVAAEHGSSISKVHAPARRLSRLYLHACKESSQPRRASAARSAVSGLVLVAKACGNDVPRLTFWLSNSVVLRAIIHQAIDDEELSLFGKKNTEMNGGGKGNKMMSSSLKWKLSSPRRKGNNKVICGELGDWEDLHEFISALEKVEAWIFSRIVESIWWQTLTPRMQSATTKAIDRFIGSGSKKNLERMSSSGDQDQGNFSLELWKNAFKDACGRLCPLRAGGHECGCLPVLARLIMEQCMARLDVAMFNAILRDSADEIPTDPMSDPISDSTVLPIPAGKSSFGAGAQLKNAIGNWSRWLTDLFGMDDDSLEEDNDDERQDICFKSFNFLNALSDLMMLPKDMLLSRSIRKEVCPAFGTPLIKRVLDNFVTDEFCSDPIPNVVLEALEYEAARTNPDQGVSKMLNVLG